MTAGQILRYRARSKINSLKWFSSYCPLFKRPQCRLVFSNVFFKVCNYKDMVKITLFFCKDTNACEFQITLKKELNEILFIYSKNKLTGKSIQSSIQIGIKDFYSDFLPSGG